MHMWNQSQAVAWLATHRTFFDPALHLPADQMLAKKAVVELALLVAYRHRLNPAPLTPNWLAAKIQSSPTSSASA